jgi:glycosyltransferase involved in cell wall biosynthesis
LGIPPGKYVIFVGGFIERKGPLRVLEALNQFEDVRGIFLGSGEQKPVGSKVYYAGRVDNADIPLWLNAADVFVLPTMAEGMSNAIIEAMACGLPLVVSDRSFNREFLTEKYTYFADPLSANDISIGIKSFLETRDSKHIRETILNDSKKYSLTLRVKRIVEFYKSIEKTSSVPCLRF